MAMVKKVIWLPYDFDTAIGINNEGQLTFGYSLEDTDTISGADVYNGQDSTFWCNLRDAFYSELSSMYNTLRSIASGVQYSYPYVEGIFETHQSYWCANIFNQDAQFKYLDPLYNDGDEGYLEMLQGSKAEQRKWWLYNRFKYLDSKYVAGDSRTQVITLRGYAVGNITVTPYADIYTVVNWANSYQTRQRVFKGDSYTHVCPLSQLNDTEIYIYTAPQIKSVGDLSSLYVGYANFSLATKLTEIILGSSAEGYNNYRAYALTVGNNTLLKKVDATNCSGLGDTTQEGHDQTSVDFSGCTNIEEIYLGGTNILSVNLPVGSTIQKLVLPGTITSLIVRNQINVTQFTCPDTSKITTLWLDNVSAQFDALAILDTIPVGSRVRLFNFTWTLNSEDEVVALVDKLDAMSGLDGTGGNLPKAQVYATIVLPRKNQWLEDYVHANYPEITLQAATIGKAVVYYDYDGSFVHCETVPSGTPAQSPPTMTREPDPTLTYAFDGWADTIDGAVDPTILDSITDDTDVFAHYAASTRYYTVLYYSDQYMDEQIGYCYVTYHGDATTYTDMEGHQQNTPPYTGSGDPEDYAFQGWSQDVTDVVSDMSVYAIFVLAPKFSRQYLTGNLNTYTDDNGLTDVGAFAFAGLQSLALLSMPSLSFSGGTIKEGTFIEFQCANGSVQIGSGNWWENVTGIEQYAFKNTVFPSAFRNVEKNFLNVLTVGNEAFKVTNVKEVLLPKATTLGASIISDTTRLGTAQTNIKKIDISRYSAGNINRDIIYPINGAQTIMFSRQTGANFDPNMQFSTSNAVAMQVLDIGYVTSLTTRYNNYQYRFHGASFETLIMRSSSMVTVNASSLPMFQTGSPLALGTGKIYVPQVLLTAYQNSPVWSAYSAMFTAIEGSIYEFT